MMQAISQLHPLVKCLARKIQYIFSRKLRDDVSDLLTNLGFWISYKEKWMVNV
jgi:hypothetical protein